ncbi:MAG: hypothetical protein HGA78_00495 [Nitrospirales bacterium]|nr:hypothetical protein [Nitrospirales bacterium]
MDTGLRKLALRIVRYEKLKLLKAPIDILREAARLIADSIDEIEEINCTALRGAIESVVFREYKDLVDTTSCFNCERMSGCVLKNDPCRSCSAYEDQDIACKESPCDDIVRWEFRINTHLDCPEYLLDKSVVREISLHKGRLVHALALKYGIHEGRTVRRIDSVLQEFVAALRAGRPLFPVDSCRN